MGIDNTQLPAEVVEEIQKMANELYPLIGDVKKKIGYKEGATEYATKLHQAEQENIELKRRSNMAIQLLTTVSKQCTMRRALLIEIKTFLDGTKE